jgi:hypothetical protein
MMGSSLKEASPQEAARPPPAVLEAMAAAVAAEALSLRVFGITSMDKPEAAVMPAAAGAGREWELLM